jgi:2,4-dienoyl-CoA reductase-like NADH-dependent reductase (Old Yellow Enzyme family)
MRHDGGHVEIGSLVEVGHELLPEAGKAVRGAGGQADAVFLARQLLRDPYWPIQAARELKAEYSWPLQYERART